MEKDTAEKILEEAKKRNKEGSDFEITSVVANFRDGELAIVRYLNNQEPQEIFIYADDGDFEVYTRSEELVRAAITKRDKPNFLQQFGLDKVLDVGGIAGLIAILIAITICASFIQNPEQAIPDVLSSALSVILGFYFGSKVSGRE